MVDDSRVAREVIKVYLIAKDVTVLDAVDGLDALEKVRAEPPDLVVADMRLPRLDGAALCEALRKDPATRAIPVVILTANGDAETRRRARSAGAREVLQKPIQPHALIEAVNRHLGAAAPVPGASR